jgi:hypothetical protein
MGYTYDKNFDDQMRISTSYISSIRRPTNLEIRTVMIVKAQTPQKHNAVKRIQIY